MLAAASLAFFVYAAVPSHTDSLGYAGFTSKFGMGRIYPCITITGV